MRRKKDIQTRHDAQNTLNLLRAGFQPIKFYFRNQLHSVEIHDITKIQFKLKCLFCKATNFINLFKILIDNSNPYDNTYHSYGCCPQINNPLCYSYAEGNKNGFISVSSLLIPVIRFSLVTLPLISIYLETWQRHQEKM